MIGIRGMIEAQVLGLTGMALKEIDFEQPKGEPGLFGPQSAIWQVHGDFTSMLCGGISALLLQMLHPWRWPASGITPVSVRTSLAACAAPASLFPPPPLPLPPTPSGSSPKCRGSISGSAGWIRTERLIRPAIRRC